ncbi:MAG: MFS transporter [Azospirillaceae bacterium]
MINRSSGLGTLLREPGVASFFAGRFLAAMGAWSERIAIGWLVWDQTQSPSLVGAAAFLRLAPAIVLSPIGGVLADRHGAVGMLRRTFAVNVALALLLALAATELPLWAILGCTALLGFAQALAAAPMKSVVPQIVARAHLPVAIPLSSATFNLAGFVGPAVAGVSIALIGLWAAFAVSAAGCLIFLVALSRWAAGDRGGAADRQGVLREIGDAIRHVRGDPALRPIFVLHLVAALCLRPFIDLLPAFVGASGAGGAAMLGLATSAIGAGAVLGAVWMAMSSDAASLVKRMLAGTLLAVACLFGLTGWGFSDLILPVVLLFGAAMVVRSTATLTLVQLVAPPAIRGRVAGLYSMTIRGGSAAGAAAIGLLAEWLGLRSGMTVAAVCCVVCLAVLSPAIGRLARLRAATAQDDGRTRCMTFEDGRQK